MRVETERWLEPMLLALEEEESDRQVFVDLMARARMPVAEADTPFADWCAREVPSEGLYALDWIRFGELLREHLGWDDYPDLPEGAK